MPECRYHQRGHGFLKKTTLVIESPKDLVKAIAVVRRGRQSSQPPSPPVTQSFTH
jgi:hypothetical protein